MSDAMAVVSGSSLKIYGWLTVAHVIPNAVSITALFPRKFVPAKSAMKTKRGVRDGR